MSLACPGPVDRQHNREKASAPLRQNKYNSKAHTPPEKRGASAKENPPPENQQETQVGQYKNNGNNTPLSDSSDSSIAVAVLWPLLIKNPLPPR